MLPQFQAIKNSSVSFTIDKMIQVCSGKVDIFKRSDIAETSIHCDSSDAVVMNTTLDVLLAITLGVWNLPGENRILI